MTDESPASILVAGAPLQHLRVARRDHVLLSSAETAAQVAIPIRYPSHWQPPIEMHNHSYYAETAAREAVRWLEESGLITSDKVRARVAAMNVPSYGGASAPMGNYVATLLNTKMTLLWLLWDDIAVEPHFEPASPEAEAQHVHLERVAHVFYEPLDRVMLRNRPAVSVASTPSSSKQEHRREHTMSIVAAATEALRLADAPPSSSSSSAAALGRFEEAWRQIATEIEHLMPMHTSDAERERFFVRFASAFEQWIQYAIRERNAFADAAAAAAGPVTTTRETATSGGGPRSTPSTTALSPRSGTATGTVSSPRLRDNWEYWLRQRALTIGMNNTAQFIELILCGFVMPEKLWNNYTIQRIVWLGALLVGLTNEIVSAAKDVAQEGWSNLVLLRATTTMTQKSASNTNGSCSTSSSSSPSNSINDTVSSNSISYDDAIKEAFLYVSELHDTYVAEFDALAELFLADEVEPEWVERMQVFFTQLRYCVRGFAFWHTSTPRYMDQVVLDGRNRAYIPVFM